MGYSRQRLRVKTEFGTETERVRDEEDQGGDTTEVCSPSWRLTAVAGLWPSPTGQSPCGVTSVSSVISWVACADWDSQLAFSELHCSETFCIYHLLSSLWLSTTASCSFKTHNCLSFLLLSSHFSPNIPSPLLSNFPLLNLCLFLILVFLPIYWPLFNYAQVSTFPGNFILCTLFLVFLFN